METKESYQDYDDILRCIQTIKRIILQSDFNSKSIINIIVDKTLSQRGIGIRKNHHDDIFFFNLSHLKSNKKP